MGSKAWELYRRAVQFGTWDPADIDLKEDRRQFAALEPAQQRRVLCYAALFHIGEEAVAIELAPWITLIDGLDRKLYLTTQIFEEAKHTEFFIRYFKEVLEPFYGEELELEKLVDPQFHYIIGEALGQTARRVQEAALHGSAPERLRVAVEAVTHYHGIVEGVLGMSSYHKINRMLEDWGGLLPGLREGYRQIRADEGRHLSFGMNFLRESIEADHSLAAVVREAYERWLPDLESLFYDTEQLQFAIECRADRWREIGLTDPMVTTSH